MIEYDGWRVAVLYEEPMSEALRLMMGRRIGRGQYEYVTAFGSPGGVVFERRDAGTEGPTVDVPTEMARALLDALAQHFGGTGDVRQLRKDHDAERARVDKLIGTLSTVAVQRGGSDA